MEDYPAHTKPTPQIYLATTPKELPRTSPAFCNLISILDYEKCAKVIMTAELIKKEANKESAISIL